MHTINLSDIVKQLLDQGFQPRDVRLQLANRGIKWNYGYSRYLGPASGRSIPVVGPKERARNLRRVGLKACRTCGQGYPIAVAGFLCSNCLIEKWSPTPGLPKTL